MQNNGMARYLSALKRTENRPYNYVGKSENGVRPFGAYSMLMENWAQWSEAAGMGGHDPLDPAAQDAVAGYWAQKLFSRYGSWEMVGAAWYAGAETADKAMSMGKGIAHFKNPATRAFVEKLQEQLEAPETEGAVLPPAARQWINPQGAPKGWLSPVAGANEWSRGSWMPNSLTHRGRTHAATDIYAKRGTPIVAPVGGKVLSTKKSDVGGFTVRVQGDDGLTYYFAHMNEQSVVKPGDTINPGAHLGFVGNSGSASATKTHLHFSIKKGNTPVAPAAYLEGAKNAGNYYSPEGGAQHQVAGQETTADTMNGFLQTVSNRISGEDRLDYRTFGIEEVEPEEEPNPMALKGGPR